MLTPAQQKVRQELEELQVRGLTLHNNETVSSIKKHSKTKWTYIGLLFFIIACSFLAAAFYKGHKHENIDTYLIKVQQYETQSDKLLKSCIEGPASDQFILQARSQQKELVRKTKELDAPSDFRDHKQDFIILMEQRLMILNSLSKRNFIALNVKQELVKDSLVKAFERKNIKYFLQEDGTIQYWLKSKSYQYR